MPKRKLRLGVLFGGRSAEHEVSIVSARSVIAALDKKKYEVIPIGITKEGRWVAGRNVAKLLESGTRLPSALAQTLPADPTVRSLVKLESDRGASQSKRLDVIIPVLHGTFGEDGTVQGLLELAEVPYVGADVLGSAVGMDKIIQKLIYKTVGIPTPEFDYFTAAEFKKSSSYILRRLWKLGLPVFVKPANLGSSVGISKVKQATTKAGERSELKVAIKLALKYDQRVIVEKAIEKSMEVEVALLGNDNPKASVPGQVAPSNEFYDYNAKYVNGKSKLIVPAPLPNEAAKKVRQLAVSAFKALALAGMARVDFLVQPKGWRIYLNEVNTIPGFTSISMYPRLWAASGLPYPKLLDKLIELALRRAQQKSKLKTSYRPKQSWYR